MDPQADKPKTCNLRLRRGETIKLPDDRNILREVTCDDIASLALAIHDRRFFFRLHRGLKIRFSRDLNGSGTQGLSIARIREEGKPLSVIDVVFSPTYKDGEFLYEADLIMDKGKDYEPTVNKGRHRFVTKSAFMGIEWGSYEIGLWRSDIDRLSEPPDSLTGWIEAGLEMLVGCGAFYCHGSVILTRSDLSRHVAAGLSLEELKTRLKCSKCGKRQAIVFPL